jgi:hypothetical protein
MAAAAPGQFTFAMGWGWPGAEVSTSIAGRQAHRAYALSFSGPGVQGRILQAAGPDCVEVSIRVDADAPSGPRTARLSLPFHERQGPEVLTAVFHVMASSAYAGGRGIGSHLI